ncbi:MAG TPA: DUF6531 domain-containing protein, partial [Acidimicrobiales bacterium]
MADLVAGRPPAMRAAAKRWDAEDGRLERLLAAARKGATDFQRGTTWGRFDGGPLFTSVQTWIDANRNDTALLKVVAEALEEADIRLANGVHVLSEEQARALAQALHRRGFDVPRGPLDVALPKVTGFDVSTGFTDDPVNAASGNFLEVEVDLAFGPLLPWLQVRRTYNSRDDLVGPHGPGWSSWATCRLRPTAGGRDARWRGPDGQVAAVRVAARPEDADDPRAPRVPGHDAVAVPAATGEGLELRFPRDGLRWCFEPEGRPVRIDAGPGAGVELAWEGDRLVALRHERGRAVTFTWDDRRDADPSAPGPGRIVAALADDGRRVTYDYDDRGRLVTVTGPAGARRYTWDDGDRLASVTDADGVVLVRNRYDGQGRVLAQRTPFGREARFTYRPGPVTEVGDAEGGPSNVWHHDAEGHLEAVVDAAGLPTLTRWGPRDRPVSVTDRRGGTTTHAYDDLGRPTRIEHPDGTWVELAWDDRHRLVAATAPDGATVRFGYTGEHRQPTEIVDPEGHATVVELDDGGLIRRVTDADGVTLAFARDAEGRVTAVTDGAGRTWRHEWDATGRPAAVTTPLGHVTRFEHDGAGRLVRWQDPLGGTWSVERSPAGRVTAAVDPLGHRTEVRYGDHGEPVALTDPAGGTTTWDHDAHGRCVRVTLPGGATWAHRYDELHRCVATVDPAGHTWRFEHDAEGAVVATVTPTGVRRTVDVDPTGRLVGYGTGDDRVTLAYDANGRLVAQVAGLGPGDGGGAGHGGGAGDDPTAVTAAGARYDGCGRIVEITEPGAGTTRFTWSPGGRLVAVEGPTGGTTRYRYDATGRLRTIVDPVGGRTRLRYDADGRLVRVTDPTGETVRWEHDAAGRTIRVTAPDGGTTRYAYDAAGRCTAVTDPTGAVTRTTYDPAGRIVAVTGPEGGTFRFGYDAAGNLATATDPTGAVTSYGHDALGRVVRRTDPLGRTTRYVHDPDGRLVARIDPDGVRHQVAGGEGSPAGGDRPVHHTWDADGNVVGRDGPDLRQAWAFDPAGRTVAHELALRDAAPAVTRVARDGCGRVVALDDPALGRVAVQRDLAGRPVRIAGDGVEERLTWRAGRLVGRSRRVRDAAGRWSQHAVAYEHDAAGRIVEERSTGGRRFRYRYDRAGQLVAASAADGDRTATWEFTWDPAGRLVGETTPDGRRRHLRYDAAGQLVAVTDGDATWSLAWDPCGRRRSETGPDGTRTYRWDRAGRLVAWRTEAPDGTVTSRELRYDVTGRLAAVDGTPVAWDTSQLLEPLVAAGTARVAGVAVPEAAGVVGRDGAVRRATPAGPGDRVPDPWRPDAPAVPLAAGTPDGGAPDGGASPDGAGLALSARGELCIDGLVWLRARVYDPATRSFLSPDPLPAVAGPPWSANPYHYAANDPVGCADPLGLSALTDQDLRALRESWKKNAWDRYGGYVVGGLMIAGGIALMATGVGGIVGSALIGAAFAGGFSAVSQQAFNGGVDWTKVALDTIVGAYTGGLGAVAAGVRLTTTSGRIFTQAGIEAAGNTTAGFATRTLTGGNPFDVRAIAVDALAGGLGGGAGGAATATNALRGWPLGTQVNTDFPTLAQL